MINKEKRTHCDKCFSEIVNDRCDCGYWIDDYKNDSFSVALERAIYAYDHMREQNNSDAPFTGDHFSGNCIALFKGDYEDCMKVRQFIEDLKMENQS
jgi:hypothetical protein